MNADNITYIIAFYILLTFLAWPLGKYMARVFTGKKTFITPIVRPIENFIYKICNIDEKREMNWKEYAIAFTIFNTVMLTALFLLQEIQAFLPLNPQGFPPVRWDTALNTAISFMTNTNWQAYAGENTMSYLTQMIGLTVHNFLSAAAGMAPLLAFIRGFIRSNTDKIGNFWVDVTRMTLYVLLPLCIIFALFLISQGVIQTFSPYITAKTFEGGKQIIALGPVASQEAIKILGTNGGGFFGTNSAHPFENPNIYTNFAETLLFSLIPAAQIFMFGYLIRNSRQGIAIYVAVMVIISMALALALWSEYKLNPLLEKIGVTGENLEGKEVRFGVTPSVLFGIQTTGIECGAVNHMHDSDMPLTGMMYMFLMGVSNIFGGCGVGLVLMLYYIILTMFIVGLMIGRTPEFLRKKLGIFEMKMAVIGIVGINVSMLTLAAIAATTPYGLSSLGNPSAHGLSEILYAYFSAHANNGSAFAGLNNDTLFYNITTGIGMLVARYLSLIPGIAIGSALAKKGKIPATAVSFPTTNPVFVIMLISVIIIVGALTFFPILTLGPGLEHLFLQEGKVFM